MWICKDCGQDSGESSRECEICGAKREAVEVASQPARGGLKFFEVDGRKIPYAGADSGSADRTTERGDHG